MSISQPGRRPRQDDEGAPARAAAFLAAAAEWSGRLDRFCDELEARGFGVERDGFTVKITLVRKADGPSTENAT